MSPRDLFNIVPSEGGVYLTIPDDVSCNIDIQDERACDYLLMLDSEIFDAQQDAVVPIVWKRGAVTIRAFDSRQATLDCAKEFADQRVQLKQQVEDDFKSKLKKLNERLRVTIRNRNSGLSEPVMLEKHI